jgi:aromatic-amino-acid transaminase
MWSNCSRGGQVAIARLLSDPALAKACDAERAKLKAMLRARVDAWNGLARPRGLDYPRYDGGFFVTVFDDAAREKAKAMREQGVYVVPQVRPGLSGALRVAVCAVAERQMPRLVNALAKAR